MSATEFIAMLKPSDIVWLFVMQLIFFAILYKTISSRQSSFIDPFTVPLIFAASAWSTVVFLYVNGMCSTRLFAIFVMTTVAFLLGYRLIAPRLSPLPGKLRESIVRHPRDLKAFMHVGTGVTFFVLATVLINLSIFGFGIQHENRLEIYTDSAGFGILKRISDALMPVSIFFLIYVIISSKKIIAFTILIVFSSLALLDGSKSGLLGIMMVITATLAWLHRNIDSSVAPVEGKTASLSLLLVLIIASFVLAYRLDAFDDFVRFQSGLGLLLFRILLAADIYVLGFPNETIDGIAQTPYPLLVLFNDLLSTLRVVSLEFTPIGTQLYNYLTPIIELSSGGPNAQLGIYAYYLFGEFFSILFSLLLGMTAGKIRKLYSRRSVSLVHGACVTALLVNTAYVLVDPSYTMHRITNLLLFVLPIYLIFRGRFN